MFLRKSIIMLAACSLATSACSKKNEKEVVKTIDTNAIISESGITDSKKAEKLALAAEQLVSPGSFMYAKDVVDQALAIDKNNKRAQMVDALISPFISYKGIMTRIKPLSDRNEENKIKYEKALADLDKQPNHALKTFVTDSEGLSEIKNEKDIQAFYDSLRNSFNKIRVFFKSNKDLDLTFNLSDLFAVAAIDEEEACHWQAENGIYEQYCFEDKKPVVLEYKLNRADNEAIQQIASGYVIYFTLLNSYNLSGALDVSDTVKSTGISSSNEIREMLLEDPLFGTLRDSTGLNNIINLGLDAVTGLRWVKSMQKEVCSSGISDNSNRPGYIFSKGLCLKDASGKNSLDNILSLVELGLKGGLIEGTFSGTYTTQTRPAAPLMGSIKDVRDLGLGFNECGKVMNAGDSTLGGVFPKRDANVIINLSEKSCSSY